ncbi:MAG: hypothetical protein OK456_05905 [Thaumarchaeota archaeon]|nr:hypothetical protein [Nitrososphaerota archaeon]
MNTRINRNFITQTTSDNASLTSMTTAVHRFREPGDYRGVLHFKGSPVRSFRIGVAKAAPAAGDNPRLTKVEVNLRALHLARGSAVEESRYELETGGYAVFRVPAGTGGGYAVEVHRSESGEGPKVFDSRELGVDDMLAVVVIRPGTYSIASTTEGNESRAELTVTYPEKYLKPLDPVKLTCTKGRVSPDRVKVQPMQGLVFSFEGPTKLRVELTAPDDRPRTPPKTIVAHRRKKQSHRLAMVPRHAHPTAN